MTAEERLRKYCLNGKQLISKEEFMEALNYADSQQQKDIEEILNRLEKLTKEIKRINDIDVCDYYDTLVSKELAIENLVDEILGDDEVEIIEDTPKKIEKNHLYYHVNNTIEEIDVKLFDTLCDIIENQRTQENKINEIIDYINSKESK